MFNPFGAAQHGISAQAGGGTVFNPFGGTQTAQQPGFGFPAGAPFGGAQAAPPPQGTLVVATHAGTPQQQGMPPTDAAALGAALLGMVNASTRSAVALEASNALKSDESDRKSRGITAASPRQIEIFKRAASTDGIHPIPVIPAFAKNVQGLNKRGKCLTELKSEVDTLPFGYATTEIAAKNCFLDALTTVDLANKKPFKPSVLSLYYVSTSFNGTGAK